MHKGDADDAHIPLIEIVPDEIRHLCPSKGILGLALEIGV